MLQKQLLDWYHQNKRDLPWRHTQNPYKIWLSEIILQQTRIQQGLPYYQSFVDKYPTVFDLAQANEDEVMKLWQGLGYYSRARNMHHTAKIIVRDYQGIFPSTYAEIIKLKGVGAYTAAAIASFAFQEPVAVLDGNVYRVLARFYANNLPINSHAAKSIFMDYAQSFLNKKDPASHNQAMMELGSLICTPTSPNCSSCPLSNDCIANKLNQQLLYPVKEQKIKIKNRYLHYLWIEVNGEIALYKRREGDIWQNLYDLPFLEFDFEQSDNWWFEYSKQIEPLNTNKEPKLIFESKHILTHQRIYAKFFELKLPQKPNLHFDLIWINPAKLAQFPVSRLLDKFINR